MLVSTLPVQPACRISTASASSPRRKSAKADPDRPSVKAKRSIIAAFELTTGGTTKSLTIMSAVTPYLSNL
ncbi:hypothetical protein D3C72_2235950 [compost metagenome]